MARPDCGKAHYWRDSIAFEGVVCDKCGMRMQDFEEIERLQQELDEMAMTAARYGWPLTDKAKAEIEQRLQKGGSRSE